MNQLKHRLDVWSRRPGLNVRHAVYEFQTVQSSENLTPQETTKQDALEMGIDGADLSCPGSSVVSRGL